MRLWFFADMYTYWLLHLARAIALAAAAAATITNMQTSAFANKILFIF